MDLVEGLFSRPALFHHLRRPIYLGTLPRLAEALALQPRESLLDVGCGTGTCATLAAGAYVGIDTSLSYLRYCRRRLPEARFRFVAMSAFESGFADGAFDKAIVINMVHHLDEAAVHRLFRELCRVVRTKVVLMDAAPEIANPLERFLLDHDRGDHLRERPALRRLIGAHFDVLRETTFHNTLRITPQVIFELVPRATQ